MINQELLSYINQSKAAGQTDEQIKSALRQIGWQEADIEEGFRSASSPVGQYLSGSQAPIGGQKKSGKKLIIIIVLVLILLAGGALAYWKFVLQKQSNVVQGSGQTQTPVACDNYDCLISAASKCQPISVSVSYSNMPLPLLSEMYISGQANYKIEKSSGVNDCVLTISYPVRSITISEKGRKDALAQGATDAQINAQLQVMNDSMKSAAVAQQQTRCPSNASVISIYLNDAKNGNYKIESSGTLTDQTTTYTTSSGQKLECEVIQPVGQPANTSTTISATECVAKKGTVTQVSDAGTACYKDQTDLGTIIGSLKLNDKYPQCCVSK